MKSATIKNPKPVKAVKDKCKAKPAPKKERKKPKKLPLPARFYGT